jgi:hypothetical protein
MPVKQRIYRTVQELGPSPPNHVQPDLKLRHGRSTQSADGHDMDH